MVCHILVMALTQEVVQVILLLRALIQQTVFRKNRIYILNKLNNNNFRNYHL